MIPLEAILNAAFTGIGAGCGSYFGSRLGVRMESHIKNIILPKPKRKRQNKQIKQIRFKTS